MQNESHKFYPQVKKTKAMRTRIKVGGSPLSNEIWYFAITEKSDEAEGSDCLLQVHCEAERWVVPKQLQK